MLVSSIFKNVIIIWFEDQETNRQTDIFGLNAGTESNSEHTSHEQLWSTVLLLGLFATQ